MSLPTAEKLAEAGRADLVPQVGGGGLLYIQFCMKGGEKNKLELKK